MITVSEMRRLEDESEKNGVSKLQLMENAGKGLADVVLKQYDARGKRILILCYHGNNGGDGFVAARYLCDKAIVDVLFLGDEHTLKDDAMTNYMKLINTKDIQLLREDDSVDFKSYDILIDALLGTGISGDLQEPIKTAIEHFNAFEKRKISVDVPTGVNPDTGEKANVYAQPDALITFHDIKKGLETYKDKTVVVDIGIPKS